MAAGKCEVRAGGADAEGYGHFTDLSTGQSGTEDDPRDQHLKGHQVLHLRGKQQARASHGRLRCMSFNVRENWKSWTWKRSARPSAFRRTRALLTRLTVLGAAASGTAHRNCLLEAETVIFISFA